MAADVVPGIGSHLAPAGDVVKHEVGEHVGRRVRDPAHPGASRSAVVALDGDKDQRLAVRAAARFAWFHAADQRVVDSTARVSCSRPGSTIARRSLCNHAHAVW